MACKCDLSISLATGEPPLLLGKHIPVSELLLQEGLVSLQRPITIDDFELSQIWDSLSCFFFLINQASVQRSKLPDDLLRDTIFSIIYRLFHKCCVPGSYDQSIRLTMLSFCARAVLQWPLLRPPFAWLKSVSERAIDRIMRENLVIMDFKTRLWVLII